MGQKLGAFFFFIVCAFSALFSSESRVTLCKMEGQLGSQLHSVAMTLGYGWKYGLEPLFDKSVFLNASCGKEHYHHLFHRLPQSSKIQIALFNHGGHTALSPYAESKQNVCFCNHRHEFWYFDEYRDEIKKLFAPSDEIKEYLRKNYSTILSHPKTVAVHIRTYHPTKLPKHLFLGTDYFVKAIELFPKECLFVIFSDRIEWCKKNIKFADRNVVYIDEKDHLINFYLMSSCKDFIVSNSTFGWWAAYLGEKKESKIYVPNRWFYHHANSPIDCVINRQFYPPNWIVFPVENDSICYDLLNYETTSLDEK